MRFRAAKWIFINGLILAAPAWAQTFEVASVKPGQPDRAGTPTCASGKFTAQTSLRLTIAWTYRINIIQLDGQNKWPAAGATFAIEGVPPGPVKEAECRAMVQSLLSERFKLAIHREIRPMDVYAMTVGKNGPKLIPVGAADGVRNRRSKSCAAPSQGWAVRDLADCMNLYLYPNLVVDHTGLEGNYDILLDFAPPRPTSFPPSKPSLA